jgi:hypothetical protein
VGVGTKDERQGARCDAARESGLGATDWVVAVRAHERY